MPRRRRARANRKIHVSYENFDGGRLWPVEGLPWYPACSKGRSKRICCRIRHNADAPGGLEPLYQDWRMDQAMPDVTIVYWRDIPAQVIVGKGRRGAKRQLEERFEQAIDRAAMKVNAKDADAYLAEWRKADPVSMEGEAADLAESEALRLEAEYDQDRLKTLIANDGWAQA
jgi:hypothetical protein